LFARGGMLTSALWVCLIGLVPSFLCLLLFSPTFLGFLKTVCEVFLPFPFCPSLEPIHLHAVEPVSTVTAHSSYRRTVSSPPPFFPTQFLKWLSEGVWFFLYSYRDFERFDTSAPLIPPSPEFLSLATISRKMGNTVLLLLV